MPDTKIDPLDPGDQPLVKLDSDPAPAETPDVSKTPEKPKKKRRTWRQRFVLLLLILVVLAVVIRIAVQVAFPIVLAKVAGGYGLKADYRQFRMSMLSGDVGLGRLEFTSEKTGEKFAGANYVRATISPFKLLIGKLEVWRVEADGVDLHLTREADGSVAVLDQILNSPKAVEGTKTSGKKTTEATKIDLTSPAYVEGFRLQHLRVHINDKALSPPVQAMMQLDVRVDDIGAPDRPAQFYVNLYSDPVLDALTIEGQGRAAGAVLDADVRVELKGLHLRPLTPYLEPLGIRPIAYDLSARAGGTLRTTPGSLMSAVSQVAAATRASTAPTTRSTAVAAAPTSQPTKDPFADAKPAESVGGLLKLKNLYLLADGREAAACDTVEIDLAKADLSSVHIAKVLIDGVRANAIKNSEGNFVAAGIELIPVASTSAATQPAGAVAASAKPGGLAPGVKGAALPATVPASSFRAALDELLVTNVRLAVEDHSVEPVTPLAFEVDRFAILGLVLDPNKPDAQVKIAGAFKSPGVARVISVDGVARPFADKKTLELTLDVSGIEPVILKPYLDFAGLDSLLKDASFKSSLSAEATIDDAGKVGAQVHLGRIVFRDREELFGLNDVRIAGIAIDPNTGVFRVGEMTVSGPTLAFKREKDGALSGFGFRTKTPTPRAERVEPRSEGGAIRLARFELGRFMWKDVAVRFDDEAAVPPASVAIGDAGLEIVDFAFDLENLEPPTQPGKIRGWLAAPNVAEKLSMEGTLTSTTDSLRADMLFAGQGITAAGLAGYLSTVGVEPLLKDGAFVAHVKTTLGKSDKGLKAAVSIEDVVYTDGQTELAGVDRVKLDNIEYSPSTLSLGSVEIARPRATVALEKDGALVAGGIRLRPPQPATQPVATPVAVAEPVAAPAPLPASGPAAAPAATPAEPFAIVLGGLKVSEGSLKVSDESAPAPFSTTATASVVLGALTLGRAGPPADLSLTLKADGIVDAVTVTGKVLANPKMQGAQVRVDVSGLRGTALAPYLPKGTAFNLKDGRLITAIDAGVEQLPAGGLKARLLVNGLEYRDGRDGPSLMKLDQFRVIAPEINPGGDVVTIDEVVLGGFELDAVRAADGSIGVLGLSLGVPSAEPAAAAEPPPPPAPATAPAAPAAADMKQALAAATQPSTPSAGAAEIVAKARKAPPLVTLNKLDLNVRRIGYIDQTVEGSKPLTVSELRLRLLETLKMLGKDPANQPPAKIEITGRVDPLIGAIDVKAQAAPFAQEPTLNAEVALTQINGEGLFNIAPKLREMIDPSGLTDGEFRTKLEATAKVDRRGPMDIDLTRGVDIDALVHNTEFRPTKGGDVMLGLEELRVESARFRPVIDDNGNRIARSVRVKSIDLVKPIGFIAREDRGIRIGGLVIKPPTPPATAPATRPDVVLAPAEPATAPTSVAEIPASQPATAPAIAGDKPAGEIRIDKLTISGIDACVVDRTVDPPFVLPLTGLDVDVRDLSSLAMYDASRSIRFAANVSSGKVTLPKKIAGGGIVGVVGGVAGLLGNAAQPEPAAAEQVEYEDRELFSQITVAGKVTLYPKPDGFTKLNISSFEVAAVSGYAKQKGVSLSQGTFDLPLDLRGDGNGGFSVDTRPAFTDLSVTEPPDGFIQKLLLLPVPLDVGIKAVEAADKSITIPVRGVTVTPDASGAYSLGGIGAQIQPAITSVFVNAIAALPAKAVSGVAAMVGIDGLLGGKDKPEEPIVLTYPAGYAGLEPAELKKVNDLIARMKKEEELTISVKHDFGGGDFTISQVRANPSSADAQAMAYNLRLRKVELVQLRAEAAATARTWLAANAGSDADHAIERLRVIDRELGRIDDALDRLYDLTRPDADRQGARRARAAALSLGQERLDVLQQMLVDAQIPGLVDRVKSSKPAFAAAADNPGGGIVTITLVKVKK